MIPNKNLGAGNSWGSWVQEEIQQLRNEVDSLKKGNMHGNMNKLVNLADNAATRVRMIPFYAAPLAIPPHAENEELFDKVLTMPDTNRNYLSLVVWGQGFYQVPNHEDMWNSYSQLMFSVQWIEHGKSNQHARWFPVVQTPDMRSGEHSKNAFNSFLFASSTFGALDSLRFRLLGNNRTDKQADYDLKKMGDEYNTWFDGTILLIESNQPFN